MSAFSIRQSVPFDLAAILQIERANPSAAHWSDRIYRELWRDFAGGRVAFVAERNGELAGFIVGREIAGEWELENVAVAPAAQRQGIGKALVQRLMATAVAADGARMFLEVRESNRAARALYELLGFDQAGRRKKYYEAPEEDALLFEKKLSPSSMKMR